MFIRFITYSLIYSILVSPFLYTQDVKFEDAGLARDTRISISDFSFFKRFTSDGKGEYLEVLLDIQNRTDDEINLKFFTLGFEEVNNINKFKRKFLPYPKWRKRDFEKEQLNIVYLDSIPKIPNDKLTEFIPTVNKYASFLQYVNFIAKNPEDGIPFFISGINGVGDKTTLTEGDNYRVSSRRLASNIAIKLYTPYGAQPKVFNHLGFVLYDTDQKRVVYRQFYKIGGKVKVR